jgi:CHAD domain-containing protein
LGGAAGRRRAALREFRELFGDGRTEHLSAELRWLGQELGGARDQEVLPELFHQHLDEIPVESVLGPVRARITGHFAPALAEAQGRVREVLDSPRYAQMLEEFESFLRNAPSTEDAERPAKDVLPRIVRRSQRRVERRMRAAYDAAPPERDRALHEARKAAKRARYAAETGALVLGKQPRKSAKALQKVQSSLGEHQDTVVARQALRTLALRAYAKGENAYTYGLLHGRLAARGEQVARRARRDWRRANRRKRTAWMSA